MSYQPPANKKPVQLVKNLHEVAAKHFKTNRKLWGQEKIDGVYAYGLCIKGDNRIFSRTGEHVLSLQHLEQELADLANSSEFMPFVAIFEVHCTDRPLNKISGAFRRQSQQFTEAVARIHDVIPYDDFVAGLCEIPYRLRYVAADFASQRLPSFTLIEAQEVALDDTQSFADNFIDAGGEGAVFKWEDSTWQAGKKNQEQMKIKQGVSYDLEVTSLEVGKGKYAGTLGKLICKWADGRVVRCSGMTDTQREHWWKCPQHIIGQVVKVDGMCLTPNGMIREPRFKEVRHDKVEADV